MSDILPGFNKLPYSTKQMLVTNRERIAEYTRLAREAGIQGDWGGVVEYMKSVIESAEWVRDEAEAIVEGRIVAENAKARPESGGAVGSREDA